MKKFNIMFFLYLFPFFYLYGQDPKEFFPMHIGDYWSYWEMKNQVILLNKYYKTIIGDTTFENGKKYYIFQGNTVNSAFLKNSDISTEYYRIDDTGNVYRYFTYGKCEGLLYKFFQFPGSFWKSCYRTNGCDTLYYRYAIVTDTCHLGIRREKKILINSFPVIKPLYDNYIHLTYVEGLGLYQSVRYEAFDFIYWILEKAIIDGKVVVDNGIMNVPVNKLTEKINYNLYPNYPNPFNPTTSIRFKLESHGNHIVMLKVFDILGREIKELVNEIKPPGVYEVIWDSKNKYGEIVSSGIYFYRLIIKPSDGSKEIILNKSMQVVK